MLLELKNTHPHITLGSNATKKSSIFTHSIGNNKIKLCKNGRTLDLKENCNDLAIGTFVVVSIIKLGAFLQIVLERRGLSFLFGLKGCERGVFNPK